MEVLAIERVLPKWIRYLLLFLICLYCKKNAKSRSDDEHRLFDPAVEKVVEIGLERLRPFENHPLKVKEDEAMARLMESIERFGIMNPLIVMPTTEVSLIS